MISERVMLIRKNAKLSREKFAERLGVTRGVIDNIEYNRAEIKDLYLQLICKEFNVNEKWLKTGEGEIYISRSEEDDFYKLIAQISLDERPEVKEALLEIASLDAEQMAIILQVLKQFNKKTIKV